MFQYLRATLSTVGWVLGTTAARWVTARGNVGWSEGEGVSTSVAGDIDSLVAHDRLGLR